jgi:hypothetical protein
MRLRSTLICPACGHRSTESVREMDSAGDHFDAASALAAGLGVRRQLQPTKTL